MDEILNELRERLSVTSDNSNWTRGSCWGPLPHITESELEAWSARLGCTRTQLYTQLAIRIAEGYHKREFSFGFCDAVVNDLWALSMDSGESFSEPFRQVFDAFDAGEYHRSQALDDNPEAQFTRPMIAEVVRNLKTGAAYSSR